MSIHSSRGRARTGLTLLVSGAAMLSAAAASNPLTPAFNQPIAFGKATKADVQQATTTAIAGTKTALTAIYNVPAGKRTFANTMVALDDLYNNLERVAGPISILFNASSTLR